jgi:LuxR family maltose regulon positive regulatory protein
MPVTPEIYDPKDISSQAGELIIAKLSAPILRSMLVRRARLTELLWAGMQRRLTLIVAPAGYGKTTLLGEWLSTITSSSWPVAWVGLDAYDNNPLNFWSYLVAALRTIQPALHFNVQGLFHGQCEPSDCTQLNPLINEIAGMRLQFSLVLDDYHEIQDETVHYSLAYFIDHLPGNCHLILSSRVLPPIPVSRLRARDQLVEVTSSDLSFTMKETEVFLSQVMKLDIPWDQVQTLVEMTEGWVAGLQLAALSLQGKQDAKGILSAIHETPRHILDYLTEEVLLRQNKMVKGFLLKTSVLEALSAPLCDAILDQVNSQEMLENLEQINLFIIPLDKQRHWYRYHALFADLLRTQLQRTWPEQAPQLHLAAYHWLKDNGFPEKAVTQAFAAGEDELAAETIEACAMQAIIRLDLATVLQWFKLLPQVQIMKRLRLLVYYALVNLMLGRGEELQNQLNSIEVSLAELPAGEIPVDDVARLGRYINAVRAAEVCMRGDFSLALPFSQEVLENFLPEDYFFLGLVEHYMGYAYQAAGRLSDGAEALESACQNALRHSFHREYVMSLSEKARFYRLQGRLREAAREYRLAIDYANAHVVGEDIRILPLAGLAEIFREWNQLPAADEQITEPLFYLLHSPVKKLDWYYSIDVYLAVARNLMLHGAYDDAGKCIQRAQDLAGTFHFFPELFSEVRAAQVRLWLAHGDLPSALNWLDHFESQEHERLRTLSSIAPFTAEQIAMARVYLAVDKPEKAGQILDALLADIGDREQGDYLVKAYILKALSQWQQGRREAATATLLQALALAEPENWVRSFIDEGAPLRLLLASTLESLQPGTRTPAQKYRFYIERLLKEANSAQKPAYPQAERLHDSEQAVIYPLIEPLSERELQILELLARGYTAGDAARELVISVNTSKAHIKNIYQKLDVHTRREAIEKAIALGLLAA